MTTGVSPDRGRLGILPSPLVFLALSPAVWQEPLSAVLRADLRPAAQASLCGPASRASHALVWRDRRFQASGAPHALALGVSQGLLAPASEEELLFQAGVPVRVSQVRPSLALGVSQGRLAPASEEELLFHELAGVPVRVSLLADLRPAAQASPCRPASRASHALAAA
jgi:hypothetical protein